MANHYWRILRWFVVLYTAWWNAKIPQAYLYLYCMSIQANLFPYLWLNGLIAKIQFYKWSLCIPLEVDGILLCLVLRSRLVDDHDVLQTHFKSKIKIEKERNNVVLLIYCRLFYFSYTLAAVTLLLVALVYYRHCCLFIPCNL